MTLFEALGRVSAVYDNNCTMKTPCHRSVGTSLDRLISRKNLIHKLRIRDVVLSPDGDNFRSFTSTGVVVAS